MIDSFGRDINYLRVSVTDRCNLRCKYCMPEDIPFISHSEILRSEEILRICKSASELGIENIRVTGGEPFVRLGIIDLLSEIKSLPLIKRVTVTTNAVLLSKYVDALAGMGIDGINISLDTLNAHTYRQITGSDAFDNVMEGLKSALDAGLNVKLNCVPLRFTNEDELIKIASLAEDYKMDIRFIEAMPIGEGRSFCPIDGDSILKDLLTHYPLLKKSGEKRGNGPARYYAGSPLKGAVGFISAMSDCFCEECNRIRLTSTGKLKLCLYYDDEVDIRHLLRSGASDGDIKEAIKSAVLAKPERHNFGVGIEPAEHRKMWQIGG